MNFNLSQKSRVYGLRLVIGCVLVGILVVGGYTVVRSLFQPRTSSKIVESEQQVKNKEVRQDLPPEKSFLGKVRSEKDGMVRVQVRGVVKGWKDDVVELSVGGTESVKVRAWSQVQYACYPAVTLSKDGGLIPFSQGYYNLLYHDEIGSSMDLTSVKDKINVGDEIIIIAVEKKTDPDLNGYIIVTFKCDK